MQTQMQMSSRAALSLEHGRCRQPLGRAACGRVRSVNCICLMVMLVLLLLVPDFIVALKDVSVMIPQAVKRGSNALLTCNYDMENDTLYSVKWYKGKREFYRYTPKENPAMKVFAMTSGLNVARNASNQSHVVLQSVPLNISGKFTCEISVEAPTFQTAMVSGEMEVVELPEEHTIVTGIQARYRIGDLVDGNCSIKYSKPAANLTWTINGIVVPPHHIKTYQIDKHENSTLESVMSIIHFMVTTQHFLKGQMRLKCTANIFDIFKEEIESIIEEDRPRIMASGRSYDINNYPLDEHTNGERGFDDHNESYLTSYAASSASTAAHEIFWHAWIVKLTQTQRQILKQITKLHRHINRQLHQAMAMAMMMMMTTSTSTTTERGMSSHSQSIGNKFDAFEAWQQQQLSLGASVAWAMGVAAITATLCLLAHQIINCQYSSKKATKFAEVPTTTTSNATLSVTMSKALPYSARLTAQSASTPAAASATLSTPAKCFYNCQMATLCTFEQCYVERTGHQTLHNDHVEHVDNDDNDDDVRDYDDGNTGDGDGNIQSASHDLTATHQRQRQQQQQQLSATLAAGSLAKPEHRSMVLKEQQETQSRLLDQRLLMTLRWEVATNISC